jgi:hypothetical protein
MRPERSEEEWDLIEQEANRAKIRELNEVLEDSDLPTYDDLKQEVERLRKALKKIRKYGPPPGKYPRYDWDDRDVRAMQSTASDALYGKGDDQG